MKIAVASGKGGTGKTTVSVTLYYFLNHFYNFKVQLVDCDVEEPNDAIFFSDAIKINERKVFQLIPKIDQEKCTFCRKCAEWCEFNAISIVKNLEFADVNNDLCHSCGACKIACDYGAIKEYEQLLGVISLYNTGIGNGLTEGKLQIGSAMQTSLIKQVKNSIVSSDEIIILDAPPGTSCPVVETVSDADFVILVSEPTPFGLYDLKLMVDLLIELKKPFGVIINKAGIGNNDLFNYLHSNNIEILGNIPFSREFAAIYATGEILKKIPEEFENTYRIIAEKLLAKTGML